MSATVDNSADPQLEGQTVPGKDNAGQAVQTNGLFTPEGTPEADDGRADAEKQRLANLAAAEVIGAPTTKSANVPTDQDAGHQAPALEDSDDEEDPEEKREREELQAKTLKEVLSRSEGDSYEILGINDEYDTVLLENMAIEKAVYSLGIEIHPKYNKDPNADKAWKLVEQAGKELECRDQVFEEVLKYGDKDPETPVQDEEIAMDGVEVKLGKPAKKIQEWYGEATPWMQELQKQPKSGSMKRKLDRINSKIKALNKEEGQENDEAWCIDYPAIIEIYKTLRLLLDQNKHGDPNALNEANTLAESLKKLLEFHYYPVEWLPNESFLVEIDPQVVREGAQRSIAQAREREQSAREGPTEGVPIDGTSSSSAVPDAWRPGLTGEGEVILAKQPRIITSKVTGEDMLLNCRFVVQKRGRKTGDNSMVFEQSEEIGQKAAKAYLGLPANEQVDIRSKKSLARADLARYTEILDIAVGPTYRDDWYPHIALKVGTKKGGMWTVVNRTSYKTARGSIVDRDIEKFYTDHDVDIPWMKRCKGPATDNRLDKITQVLVALEARTKKTDSALQALLESLG